MLKDFTILLDMDEVFVDFTGGACLAHGITREQLETERTATSLGVWTLEGPIGYAKGLGRALAHDEFWQPIHDRGEQFWVDLLPLPWADRLVDLLLNASWKGKLKCRTPRESDANDDWHIVSGPSRLPESHSGKVRWLKAYFGLEFDRFCLTPHKELFARDNTVLIDDRQANCDRFTKAGGHAILFPSPGNCLYHYADNPVPYVHHQLNLL